MESVSRPPHRRKHSSTNANAFVSFSLKNPYDDVVLSGGGKKTKSFGAHEYAEIFAASSSSIPVLDLSGLDERVGSGDGRSSKLDYSSIFGGLRDDDVAVPYEDLFNGAKKTRCSSDKSGIPADAGVHLQESGSIHSPGKTQRSSAKSADQSVDAVKQQFNLSFNKTSQRNDDASNRKTHLAQLHDVPGFTYFIDGSHQLQKTEDDKPVPLLRREVSRTWSFTTDLEAVKSKGRSSSDKFHTPDESHNVTESNLKAHLSNVPPPSSHPSNIKDHNDSKASRLSCFPDKENASVRIDRDSSPPLFEEELDENSVAAISAAALKKAIEQAQESIRIAKMIMEKKREGLQDGSKPRPKGRLKVKDKKENRIDLKVRDNVEEAKEHGEAFNGVGKNLATSCSQSEAPRNIEKVELEKLATTVEAAEAHKGVSYFPELVAKAECTATILEYGKLDNKNEVSTMNKLASNLEEMETGEETLEQIIGVHHSDGGPEDVAELADRAFNISRRTKELERIVDETLEQREIAVDYRKGPQHVAELGERALNNSQNTPVQEKTLGGAGANLRTSQEEKVTETCHDVTDDQGICENKSEACDEVVNVANLNLSNFKFDNSMNESRNLDEIEASDQKETEKKFVNVPEWRENGHIHEESMDEEENGIRQKEAHIWSESKEQLKEALEEVINESAPEVFPEIKEVENSVNEVHEAAVDDKKLNCAHDGDGKGIQAELEQNAIEGSHMDTIEDETVETKQMEGNNCNEFEKNEVSRVSDETNNPLRGAGRGEENEKKSEFQESAYEIHAESVNDGKINDINTNFNETHCNNASGSFSENQESCDVDFNNSRVEENGSIPGLTETCSVIDMDKTEPPFHMENNDTCTTDSLHRSSSEDNFVGSSLHYVFDSLPFNYKNENVGVTNANNEEKLPKDEDISKTSGEIHNNAQETADKFIFQDLPEVHPSDFSTAEYDVTDVRLVSEQTSEMDGRSESTFSVENLDGLTIHESEKCAENGKNETSEKEEVEDNVEMTSNDMNHVQEQTEGVSSEEQSEGVYSQLHSELKEMEESMESEKSVERGQILDENNENVNGISTSEEKNAKENVQNFDKEDQQQRIEAIKRGREREKDRIAVERAIREARERAFAEARERAERAAVERATADVRQRVMADAREKLEKASTTSKQPAVKASTEAKLRSERAAVERATAEARERALEKAMSQKTSTEGKSYADRYPTERLSGASRNNALKHSFSSSDLENFDGTSNESAQRRKARLERHQRIMERAAKALAEKNMRDLLAQKEQAERNRLAESLDADIKRWVTGKEGNLRALLSTLQYILGPNSGWQPISLTEIITTPAVKKAYRKATLYVHPDKLQQRGASIQQKYICEKVFDLLKAAWNRFNSEER